MQALFALSLRGGVSLANLRGEIATMHQARTGRHGDGCDDPEFGGSQKIIHGRPPVQECRRG
jgi:hypothetical protein